MNNNNDNDNDNMHPVLFFYTVHTDSFTAP